MIAVLFGRRPHDVPDQAADRPLGVAVGALLGAEVPHDAVEARTEEPLLRPEVPVDERDVDAGVGSDVAHGRGSVAVEGEPASRGLHEQQAGGLGVLAHGRSVPAPPAM